MSIPAVPRHVETAIGNTPHELEERAAQIDALRDSVRTFVSRQNGLGRIRDQRGQIPGYSRSVWQQMAELGWLGVMVPQEHGGTDMGLSAAVLLSLIHI